MAPPRRQASAASGFRILVDRAACCAQWRSEAGDDGVLTPSDRLSCKIGYNHTNGEAVFRLYVPFALTTSPANRKTPFYVFIDPPNISSLQSLPLDGSEGTQACVNELISHSQQCSSHRDIIALQLLLKNPVVLVGPKETTSLEQGPETGNLLKTLRSLLLSTNLTLYLPRNKTLVDSVDDLCARALNGSFLPPPRIQDLPGLYSGAGGADVTTLLMRNTATGERRQLPAYQDATRPTTFVSGQASGKRRRTDKGQGSEAWMQRIEKQQSELGDSLALLRAEMDDMRKERDRERSTAPLEFSYTRPVTRSVSARPEAQRQDEMQRHLQQMHTRVGAIEQRLPEVQRHLQQMHTQLGDVEHRMHEVTEQHNQIRDTDQTADLQGAPSSAPHDDAPEQQSETSRVPETLPNSQTSRVSETLPNSQTNVLHGIFSDRGSSRSPPPTPPSEIFGPYSDDEFSETNSHTHSDNVGSDEEREALVHANGAASPPLREVWARDGENQDVSDSPNPPSSLFTTRTDDDERLALQAEQAQQSRDDLDADAEREHLAHLASRGGGNDAPSRLTSELVEWLRSARALGGSNVHEHPQLAAKLTALGRFAGSGNVVAFDTSRAWCSALLLFHGSAAAAAADDMNDAQQREQHRLVSDLAGLARWANQRRRLCDMCIPAVRAEFRRLGGAARAAAAASAEADGGRRALASYERQRDVCVVRVLTLR